MAIRSNHARPSRATWGSFMYARLLARLAFFAALAMAPAWGWAQDKKPMPPNPVGASGNWAGTISKEAAISGEEFDKKQMELIQKVATYFNQMSEIKGLFIQTSADNKRQRGKFYFKRPGKFRFDYKVWVRAAKPKDTQTVSVYRSMGSFGWFANQVDRMVNFIEKMGMEDPWPLRDTDFLCGPKWCPFWDSCKGSHIDGDRWY